MIESNSILTTIYLNYFGPFSGDTRDSTLAQFLIPKFEQYKIKIIQNWALQSSYRNDLEVLNWNENGLPSDPTSVENGIIITKSSKFSYVIDPLSQANNFIKRQFNDLVVIDMQTRNIEAILERCIKNGEVLLFQNAGE